MTDTNSKKIVVAAVPFTDTTAPIMAPALFKGILDSAGFDCIGIDLNGKIFNFVSEGPDREEYLRFFYFDEISVDFELKIKSLFDYMANEILQHNPSIVCLSLLHYQCQYAATWLSFYIKKVNPNIKIIIGGAGAFGHGLTTNEESYTSRLKNQGLIDHYISGDGDIALLECIKGNLDYPGIDTITWKPIEDLNNIAYPNYDDYDFNNYKSPFLGVLGSRGCVRQCTFCDIHEYWEKFKWRTGDNIFEEMLAQNKKYRVRHFKFQDSLINGNVKEYNRLLYLLSEHNKNNPDNQLLWASYFIFRPATQMSEEQWRLTAESGCMLLKVGIESLVEKNRNHMKKKFSNQDIQHSLEMAKKYNIKLLFLLIIGYVTETEEDHLETLEWFEKNKNFANHPIADINIGGTLAILPGTWLDKNKEQLGVTWREQKAVNKRAGTSQLWEIKSTGNDYETRIRRLKETLDAGLKNNFRMHFTTVDPQKELENSIKEIMINGS